VQRGQRAAFPPGEAREDWTILRALSAELGKVLPYDTLAALREAIVDAAPQFGDYDEVVAAGDLPDLPSGELDGAPFETPIRDFHLTNPIARASKVMATCSAELAASRRGVAAAE
jgi:NADH-quinone oxidoreductase subunit G